MLCIFLPLSFKELFLSLNFTQQEMNYSYSKNTMVNIKNPSLEGNLNTSLGGQGDLISRLSGGGS